MNSTPNWKLRRLAPRALRVLERRAQQSPAIAAYVASLKPHAETMISAYDEAGRYRADWLREMMEGRGAVAELQRTMRCWLPMFERDVPGFDGSSFGDNQTVPDDVMEDAGRLVDTAADYEANTGQPLTYAAEFSQSLGEAIGRAYKEWAEAEGADNKYRDLLASVREAAELLGADMTAFRRTLIAVVGRRDGDFQKLRARRAHLKDEDDDADAPDSPAKVQPAAPDAGPPAGPGTGQPAQPGA